MEFSANGGIRKSNRRACCQRPSGYRRESKWIAPWFSTLEWFEKDIPVTWEMNVAGGKITGHQKRSDGVEGQLTGVHAPALQRKPPASWGKPESLFNGKDLAGWQPFESSKITGKRKMANW